MGKIKAFLHHAWPWLAGGLLFLVIDAKTGGKVKGLIAKIPFGVGAWLVS